MGSSGSRKKNTLIWPKIITSLHKTSLPIFHFPTLLNISSPGFKNPSLLLTYNYFYNPLSKNTWFNIKKTDILPKKYIRIFHTIFRKIRIFSFKTHSRIGTRNGGSVCFLWGQELSHIGRGMCNLEPHQYILVQQTHLQFKRQHP